MRGARQVGREGRSGPWEAEADRHDGQDRVIEKDDGGPVRGAKRDLSEGII